MNFNTNLVVITKDGSWYRIGECAICLITDEEYKKLVDGINPKEISAVAQMALKTTTHMDIGALLW